MTTLGQIYDCLDGWAPFSTQASYDNAGLLVGSREREARRVGVALDVTSETLSAAQNEGCDAIITHHPVIFRPIRSIGDESLLARLIRAGIAVLSAHTNLDAAEGGVNDLLAGLLGLEEVEKLADPNTPGLPPGARMGRLPRPLSAEGLARLVKDTLDAGGVRFTDREGPIERVAVCGGAGADDFMLPAMAAGCGALVTGEAKHHQWLAAREDNFCLIDGGHFSTERIVKKELAHRLAGAFPDLQVCLLAERDPARYLI
ncbi:MAG: Nif3-like dinuclear metal center hexameric protein [Clostridiales bacterium]|nr:Nif3-like dinuclear metal center hexameric protein [Clostridiales bacterium]